MSRQRLQPILRRRLKLRAPAFTLAVLIAAGCAGTRSDNTDPTGAQVCRPAPMAAPLFLRGSMTNWALDDDYVFQYVCNEYLLNVDLRGLQQLRITDAASTPVASFGRKNRQDAAPLKPGEGFEMNAASEPGGAGAVNVAFDGEHTLHLRFDPTDSTAKRPTLTVSAKDFADPARTEVTDPIALSLHFDSRASADKQPFGALTSGSQIDITLHATPGVTRATLVVEKRRLEGPQEVLDYAPVARVPLVQRAEGAGVGWHGSYRFAEIGIYGYYFEIETGTGTWLYQNNSDSVYWTREKGSGGLGKVQGLTDPLHRIRRFRQTVYRPDYRVPAWARDAVFYYIFPERFRNGNRGNDPQPGPHTFRDTSVEVHKDWLDRPWVPHSGDGSDDSYGNDFFGGDLAGIIEKLDYIAALGANTLYLTPIFQAASNHKYDTADYRRIDPHFGSNADFERLTKAARQHGLRVIVDTSLNHSGSDSLYFNRYGNFPEVGAFDRGAIHPESRYADWYRFDPLQPDAARQYRGWVGAQDLPELNKASASFRNFAFGAPDAVMKLWLDRGAAGWRMDVAPWVPDDFWRAWRSAVKRHRRDALTIAETQFDASKFLLGDEFDSTMNYIFRNAVEDYANGKDARVIYRNIELMRENYPPQAFFALMNLLSTHDSARALFDFGYHDENADAATIVLAKQRLRLAAFFQMIFPGAPAVFYGDEAGVTGGEDPFNRATYPWADLGGRPDGQLIAQYTSMIALRKAHPVLRHGSLGAPAYLDEHVIVLVRRDGKRWAITATNNDRVAHTVTISVPGDLKAASFLDALTGARTRVASGTITFEIPAMFGSVLEDR